MRVCEGYRGHRSPGEGAIGCFREEVAFELTLEGAFIHSFSVSKILVVNYVQTLL